MVMEIRVGIEVPLEKNARPTYVEESLKDIDAVQTVQPDYDNSKITVTADFSTLSEGKNVMKRLNRIVGVGLVDTLYLI